MPTFGSSQPTCMHACTNHPIPKHWYNFDCQAIDSIKIDTTTFTLWTHLLNRNRSSSKPRTDSCIHLNHLTFPSQQDSMANSIDYIAIQNVLARYCFALDTKDLNMLHQVLTPGIDAQYPFPGGDMQGIEAVIATISKR